MFRVSSGEYELCCQSDGVPDMTPEYQRRAALSDVFESADEIASWCFTSVARNCGWPFLVVVQRYSPAGFGFFPGALLIPEYGRLFLGAGRRLLAYDLSQPSRILEDETDCGFWSWTRHGRFVLMAAELELAAWDIEGKKLWSRFVEPPWEYKVEGDIIRLAVMGTVSEIGLRDGRESV
jgi:hypothetical protein